MAKIVVLATGGTIAGQGADANDGVAYQAAQIDVEGLLGGICGLQDLLGADTCQDRATGLPDRPSAARARPDQKFEKNRPPTLPPPAGDQPTNVRPNGPKVLTRLPPPYR